jgi:hypothetical protein
MFVALFKFSWLCLKLGAKILFFLYMLLFTVSRSIYHMMKQTQLILCIHVGAHKSDQFGEEPMGVTNKIMPYIARRLMATVDI